MGIFQELNRRAGQVIMPVVCACFIGYFAYHTVQGDKGLLAYFALSQEIAQAAANLEKIRGERRILEHRVALLNGKRLDLDLLDEQARALLNVVHDDEIVILRSPDTDEVGNTK